MASSGTVGADEVALGALVTPGAVVVGAALEDAPTAIRTLADLLAAAGAVAPGYGEACVARELTDPTGLPASLGVAIPHGDPGLVRRPAVAIAVPARPVPFRQMGDPDLEVAAHVVFLLAVRSGAAQLRALREVAELVQDEGRLARLAAATDAATVIDVVRSASGPDGTRTEEPT